MTRKEFSDKLVECREKSKCGKNELCRRTGFTFVQLQRLEKSLNNFSIDNVFVYLEAINYGMYIIYNESKFYFKNREIFSDFFKKTREELGISQLNFAKKIGFSYIAIISVEHKKTNTSIDIILSILNEIGAEIIFKKKRK